VPCILQDSHLPSVSAAENEQKQTLLKVRANDSTPVQETGTIPLEPHTQGDIQSGINEDGDGMMIRLKDALAGQCSIFVNI